MRVKSLPAFARSNIEGLRRDRSARWGAPQEQLCSRRWVAPQTTLTHWRDPPAARQQKTRCRTSPQTQRPHTGRTMGGLRRRFEAEGAEDVARDLDGVLDALLRVVSHRQLQA
jgi:hypothetical protein